MRYQNLLFSRSLNEEYRWILVPSFFSPADKTKIYELMWLEEIRAHLPVGLHSPFSFSLILLPQSYVLARFGRTQYIDKYKRPIDYIDGIAVHLPESWLLRLSLSWLLTDHLYRLNSWENLDFQKSGYLTDATPQVYDFDLNNLVFSTSSSDLSDSNLSSKEFPFNQNGFNGLISCLYPSPNVKKLDLLQIAYGVTPSIARQCKDFDIITVLSQFSTRTPLESETIIVSPSEEVSSNLDFNERVKELKKKNKPKNETPPASSLRKKPPLLWKLLNLFSDDEA